MVRLVVGVVVRAVVLTFSSFRFFFSFLFFFFSLIGSSVTVVYSNVVGGSVVVGSSVGCGATKLVVLVFTTLVGNIKVAFLTIDFG